MPTYDYKCAACGHVAEIFHSITAKPRRKCPACGASKLERQIGPGAGFLFKGSGFYQTDYRSDSYTKAAKAEGASGDRGSADKSSSEKGPSEKGSSEKGSSGKGSSDNAPAAPSAPAKPTKSPGTTGKPRSAG